MIERTVLEIAQQRFWAWKRKQTPTPRTRLQETDELLSLVEECRVRSINPIPADIWRRIVHLVGQVDRKFSQRLGIDRSPDRTSDILFEAQESLMRLQKELREQQGKIIPLFRPRS